MVVEWGEGQRTTAQISQVTSPELNPSTLFGARLDPAPRDFFNGIIRASIYGTVVVIFVITGDSEHQGVVHDTQTQKREVHMISRVFSSVAGALWPGKEVRGSGAGCRRGAYPRHQAAARSPPGAAARRSSDARAPPSLVQLNHLVEPAPNWCK